MLRFNPAADFMGKAQPIFILCSDRARPLPPGGAFGLSKGPDARRSIRALNWRGRKERPYPLRLTGLVGGFFWRALVLPSVLISPAAIRERLVSAGPTSSYTSTENSTTLRTTAPPASCWAVRAMPRATPAWGRRVMPRCLVIFSLHPVAAQLA